MDIKHTLRMPKTTFDMKANLPVKEPQFISYWDQISLYQKMLDKNQGNEEFQLHDGPPYANGDIHVGHMLNRILKDIVVRYKHMLGFHTPFVFGWDTHGLPIENYLSKQGINRKTMSVADFRNQCSTFAKSQVERQKSQIKRIGVMGDFDHPYLTLDKDFEASQIHVFAKMALKGLIYKGLKPVHWSPSSESALAEAEIVYEDVNDTAIYVGFDVIDGKGVLPLGAKIVIWTTTPWTIPANLAISAHPDFQYGLYDTNKGPLLIAEKLIQPVKEALGLTQVHLRQTLRGKSLEFVLTKHPFYDRNSPIILGTHVTDDAGTGFVHTAPGHGEEDFIVGAQYKLPPLCPVDSKGFMTEEAGVGLSGLFYAEANKKVIDMLMTSGHLLASYAFVHAYPHDWRTNKPLIYRATPQWFASIEPIRQTLLSEINRVTWTPSWGQTRIHNMIKDRGDWCISRQRAWGVPIPILYHEDGTPIIDKKVFDHIESLIGQFGSQIWFEKDAVDLLPKGFKDPRSPLGLFRKETDIMDVWFDSGSSSLGVLKKRGMKFPSDLYLEGSDQYRGWFNSSLIIAVATEGVAPYQHVVSHGFVVDGKGEKMSKSKGNGIDPLKMMQVYGADIMRLWAASIDFSQDARASEDIFKVHAENYRKIRNTFKFMLGNLTEGEGFFDPSLSTVQRFEWVDHLIVSKFEHVKLVAKQAMDAYNFSLAMSEILTFVTQTLSSFYLDITKDILYCERGDSERRKQVQHVLYKITTELSRILTPILPFTMEEIYQTIGTKSQLSIQLESYPSTVEDCHDELDQLEAFLVIRESVLKALESLRATGTIGSSQEAEVFLTVDASTFKTLSSLDSRELNRLFIVSSVNLKEGKQAVSVMKYKGEKCPRCWNYFEKLIPVEEHHVCERCAKAMQG
jgi:isoleucyl-tRNA synthetase